jgi:hypothetical protein
MTRDDFLIDGVWVATVWLAAVFAVNAAAAALFG